MGAHGDAPGMFVETVLVGVNWGRPASRNLSVPWNRRMEGSKVQTSCNSQSWKMPSL